MCFLRYYNAISYFKYPVGVVVFNFVYCVLKELDAYNKIIGRLLKFDSGKLVLAASPAVTKVPQKQNTLDNEDVILALLIVKEVCIFL